MKIAFTRLLIMTFLTPIPQNLINPSPASKPTIEQLFNRVKTDPAALRQFLWQMPKGGDIHHHFIGSVFAEHYVDAAIKGDLWINPVSYHLYFDQADALAKKAENAISVRELVQNYPDQREEMIDHWSVRNHQDNHREGHHWFFASFEKFLPAVAGNEAQLLSELCRAAREENLQYLETMVEVPSILARVAKLTEGKSWEPGRHLENHLEEWFQYLEAQDLDHWAAYNAEVIDHWHYNTDKHGIELKFQTAAFRIYSELATVFAHLMLAFKTATLSEEIRGVNFVAPEDHHISLTNYDTHMVMIRFMKARFPEVNLSLHAGELVIDKGDAREKDLTFHIDHALTVAGAQRIGHGVDINSETRKDEVLAYMKENKVAVETNLGSNEVILETDSETHPIKTYLSADVPVCISSDDAGILRSDLTHQYELLIKYVPDISYKQLKTIVSNSITYSFLGKQEKMVVAEKLEKAFGRFEHQILTQ